MVAVSAVCNLDYPLFPIEHLKLSGIPELTVSCWVSFVELSPVLVPGLADLLI